MLKIKPDKDCSLVMQRRDRLFTPLFIRAFFIALALHFFGLMSLKVEKEKLPTSLWVFPYIDIEVDLRDLESHMHESPLTLKIAGSKDFTPPRSQPMMPKFRHRPYITAMTPPTPLKAPPSLEAAAPALTFPREEMLNYTFERKLTLTGALAGRKFHLTSAVPLSATEEGYALYEITVDEKLGRVISHKKIEGDSAIDPAIEQILERLQITPDEKKVVSHGFLEIEYHRKGKLR